MPVVPTEGPTVSRLAVVACWLAVAVRVVLVLGLIAISIVGLIAISIAFATHPAGTWDWRTWDWMYDIVLGVFIIPMLVYIALAFTLRCPSCRRCVLVERGKKHPASRKMGHLGYWGTVVRDILRERQFTCMHCGTPCRVR
jgi:hypothetical protein